ncbi:MAG TPA: peptidoglycan DD-metalloendopeptidase family protein [Coriobacteriia bacterium]
MRFGRLRILVSLALALALVPGSAQAADIAALKAQKARLSKQLQSAGWAFRKALYRLEANEDRIADLQKRSKRTKADLDKAQGNLKARAQTWYRMGDLDFVSVLLDSTDYDDLFTRMDFVRSIVDHDASQVRDIKALRAQLVDQERELRAAHSTLASNAKAMRSKRRALDALLKTKQREYEALKAELGAAAGLTRTGYAPAGPNGLVFPVDGPCYYDDTWGAPRSGGRTHKGTDIMAASGTPVVATCDGTVSSKQGGLGGKVIYLSGNNGWRFYYAHLSGYAVRSGRVRAGQLIAYVGSTGNAAGGAPHLHFQMWTPGGAIVDPYPYLRQMQR